MNLKGILLCLIALSISIDAGKKKLLKKLSKELGYNLEKAIKQITREAVNISLKVEDSELGIKNIEDKVATNTRNVAINAADIATYHPEPIILVSTGYEFTAVTTEIINTDNSGLTCKDLEEYPLQTQLAVGFNMGSLPVICGGDDGSAYLNQCYRMESGIWKPFVNLAQGRGGAAGISYAQSSIIFGGRSDSLGILSSTEIITEQGVSPGPEMPKRVYTHAIASVNETTSILTGGHSPGGGVMEKTWFFCHVSQQFQKGPSLITARRFHASGTIQDKVTMENIVAVIGGSGRKPQGYYADFLNSTELLFNGESAWQQGPQMPKELYLQSAVEIGGDLYLIGGLFNDGSCECKMDLIQRMSCSARVCTLTTMTQKLKVARGAAVGIKIPRSFCVPV